ncbi:MAG: siderophore-interacting protein [Mycobacteriales bacterium]
MAAVEASSSIREELRRRAREPNRLRVWQAEVIETAQLTPRVRRLTLAGDDLATMADGLPADGFKAAVFAPGVSEVPGMRLGPRGVLVDGPPLPAWRSYTVRHHDPRTTRTDVDVVLHDDSPGTRWATSLAVGDLVIGHGPRSDFYAAPGVDLHVLAGDDTAAPAIAAILQALPATARVIAVIEVQDAAEQIDLPGNAEVHWLHRCGVPPGRSELLAAAVRRLPAFTGRVQAWAGAESGAVRAIRAHWLRERELPSRDVHAVGFWRLGHAGSTD